MWIILASTSLGATTWADEPEATPRSKDRPAIAKAKAKAAAKDDPPPCRHMVHASNAKAPSRGVARRSSNRSVPSGFNRMMSNMARNPAGGFPAIMRGQQAEAVRETTLTAGEERRIGRKNRDAFLKAARSKGFTVREVAKDTDYLKALVAKLSKRMKNRARYPEIEVTIIDAPIPDGQSFPGGFLVFTRGLLDEPDEATVAGVVAHELAHLDRGHLNEYARRDKVAQTAFQFGPEMMADPSRMMNRMMAVTSMMMDPFRPEHEHEADCTAATWLYLEGYSPQGLADFFTRMNNRLNDRPDDPFWKLGRSHPYTLDRRRAVLERLKQLQDWKPRDDLKLEPGALRDRSVVRGG